MEVVLQASGLIEKSLGFSEKKMVLNKDATVEKLLKEVNLTINKSWLLVTVNGKRTSVNKVLNEGDQVKLLAICGGG